jgi:hypothetical protein
MGPGLINPRNTCHINASVQLLFHILPLRLIIVAWPNRDPIIPALRLMFVAMSQNRPINIVSLSIVCEPDVLDDKDCFELVLQILGALRDASSGMLRDTIEELFCFRQISWFSTAFSSICVPKSTSILLTPSRFRILYFDGMPEFWLQDYSTWCWTTSNATNFLSFIS